MVSLPIEDKRNRVLLSLYELRTSVGSGVNVEELQKVADVGADFYEILKYFGKYGKGFLEKRNLNVFLTAEGTDRAEELKKMQIIRLERELLQKFYDLGGPTHMGWVLLDTLTKELNMKFSDLNPILNDLEDRNLLGGNGEAMWLTPAGVREVENPGDESRHIGTTIQNIFHAPVQGGFIQGGHGHVQHNTFTNNPKVEETITSLTRLIQESSIDASDKEDIIKDVERVKELTSKEKTPDSLQRINRRIDMIKTGIAAADTAEKGGKLLIKATPYLVTLWQLLTA